jgi:hypothetical protein
MEIFEKCSILPAPFNLLKFNRGARPRQAKFLTAGIHRVFRGLKFEPDADMGEKDSFHSSTIKIITKVIPGQSHFLGRLQHMNSACREKTQW